MEFPIREVLTREPQDSHILSIIEEHNLSMVGDPGNKFSGQVINTILQNECRDIDEFIAKTMGIISEIGVGDNLPPNLIRLHTRLMKLVMAKHALMRMIDVLMDITEKCKHHESQRKHAEKLQTILKQLMDEVKQVDHPEIKYPISLRPVGVNTSKAAWLDLITFE